MTADPLLDDPATSDQPTSADPSATIEDDSPPLPIATMPGLRALPVGTTLLHIGPHKTGTTSVQSALHARRRELAEHGVRYAGRQRHSVEAALAVTGARNLMGRREPLGHWWEELVEDVNSAGDGRVVVSSEFYAEADDAAVRRILTDLGGATPHVVVTLRPLARILPSQWQQYLQNGLRNTYEDWLHGMFDRPPYDRPTPSFWKRHRHADVVQRWADAAGPENVTVIAVDDSNRRMLMHSFETMLALPEGLLKPPDKMANRSLTAAEAELLRSLNVRFREREWSEVAYSRFIRFGSVLALQRREPGREEERIATPDWALDRAAQLGAEAGERIAAMGVCVVGDLGLLATRPPAERSSAAPAGREPGADQWGRRQVEEIPTDVGVVAMLATIKASGVVDAKARSIERRPVADVTVPQLAGVIKRRLRRKARGLLR